MSLPHIQTSCSKAYGGVLFIDEAYTLAKGGNNFGQEAIDTLLKAMEEYRDDLVVIVAGHSQPMKAFLGSIPGIREQWLFTISREDIFPYTPKKTITAAKSDFNYLCPVW